MSQSREGPDGSGTGGQATVTLSRPFGEMIHNVLALAGNRGAKDTENWVQQAGKHIQWAKSSVIGDDIERAFINYASAAVILRAILPRSPGYSQAMGEEQTSITSESCRYIRLFEQNLITGNVRYYVVPENRLVRDRKNTQNSWRQLRDMTRYNEGAEEDEHESSSSAIQMDAGDVTGQQDLPTSSRSPKPNLISPQRRGSIPEMPPSPPSHWIELHPIDNYEQRVPEVAPEPTSLYVDLHPLEDDEYSIPEAPPEPRSMWIELRPVRDGNEHIIPKVAPEPTALYLDLHPSEDDADSITDNLPRP
ncbi:hypothetical protein FIBSPDRAFT_896780 [Athelia psychrophila]|uniref:USP8 dimerisation domain-containing protein n=1 Tax=Athelia psychrophila TaxID=1759441 RepID=A0A166CZ58_9AGAM|nr:hypothetical protein FIBSPDRAFT_896780 [Fibularhizoctonia sp. CBS 109695]